MLVPDKEALARLNSSSNLINRLRNGMNHGSKRASAMGLFVPSSSSQTQSPIPETQLEPLRKEEWNPFSAEDKVQEVEITLRERLASAVNSAGQTQARTTPTAAITTDDILTNADGKIKIAQAHDDALSVLSKALTALSTKVDDVKPEKLPQIIAAAMKTVESIRKEKMQLLADQQGREVHFHFYEPKRREIKDYEIIDVG